MNGLATINQLNQRAVEHAEANRILKSHGLPEVAGAVGSSRDSAYEAVGHFADKRVDAQ